jgi:hypothetical protein
MPSSEWAGSPTASSPTGPKPSGAYALAEQLGSVNAAATQLGTTWPSLRKAFTRHRLGMPARSPHRAIRHGRLLAITAILATAVVLLLMAGVVRPV